MKKLLLLVAILPSMLWAQNEPNYLAGAVPEVNGKVLFVKTIELPTLTKEQTYDVMLRFAQDYCANSDDTRRIVLSDNINGDIAITGREYIIFKKSALSIDRAMMSYQVIINCENQKCNITFGKISYEYNNPIKDTPDKLIAEMWITDRETITKKNTLSSGNGKFRIKTVDFVNELFGKVDSVLGIITPVVAPATPSTVVVPATPIAPPSTSNFVSKYTAIGYVSMTTDKIPSTIMQMLSNSIVTITTEVDQKSIPVNCSWKGIGTMFGKKTASITIDSKNESSKEISTQDTFLISFTNQTGDEPWCVIECLKQGETPEEGKVTIIGEILNIAVK